MSQSSGGQVALFSILWHVSGRLSLCGYTIRNKFHGCFRKEGEREGHLGCLKDQVLQWLITSTHIPQTKTQSQGPQTCWFYLSDIWHFSFFPFPLTLCFFRNSSSFICTTQVAPSSCLLSLLPSLNIYLPRYCATACINCKRPDLFPSIENTFLGWPVEQALLLQRCSGMSVASILVQTYPQPITRSHV